MKTVLVTGCFDLFHYGHLKFLEAAAACGDYLIVGVAEDDTVRRVKGENRPIYPLEHRIALLEACRHVASVEVFSLESQLDLVDKVSPDVCVEGADGNARLREILDELELNTPVQTVYTDFIHTTDIVEKILNGKSTQNIQNN